jgi:diadenosine tetraphosphatase ApaH/serine/threonine PP2A family protein phosphatase
LDIPDPAGRPIAEIRAIVNCGSVGKPKDSDPRGAFAVLTPSTQSVDVSIERIAYDADAVAAEVRDAGLPGEFADKLLVAA